MTVTAVALTCFGALLVLALAINFRRSRTPTFLFFFTVMFVLSYAVAPVTLIAWGTPRAFPYPTRFLQPEAPLAVVAIIACYIVTYVAYTSPLGATAAAHVSLRWRVSRGISHSLYAMLLVAGVGGMAIFIHRYGGLDAVLAAASRIRSGAVERDNLGAIARMFGICLPFAFWIYFARFYVRLHADGIRMFRYVAPNLQLVVIAGLAAIAIWYGTISAGRLGLIMIALIPYLTMVMVRGDLNLKVLVPLVVVAAGVILFGKTVIFASLLGPDDIVSAIALAVELIDLRAAVLAIVMEFAHPFISLNAAISHVASDVSPRYFGEWPLGILFYLKLFGLSVPDSIAYLNTYLIRGEWESTVPPGIVALFWYEATLPGVLIESTVFGIAGRFLNDLLLRVGTDRPALLPFYLYAGFNYGGFVVYGEPRVMVMAHGVPILAAAVVLLFCYQMTFHVRRKTALKRPSPQTTPAAS